MQDDVCGGFTYPAYPFKYRQEKHNGFSDLVEVPRNLSEVQHRLAIM